MRIEILNLAIEDLTQGFRFYESQSKGLGDYFIDSIFSDIESLQLYAGMEIKRKACLRLSILRRQNSYMTEHWSYSNGFARGSGKQDHSGVYCPA